MQSLSMNLLLNYLVSTFNSLDTEEAIGMIYFTGVYTRGSNLYQVDLSGQVIYMKFACSHDTGGVLLPDPSGNFPFLCTDDGNGIQRPGNH